ncbi:creatininase family protein [Bradyrhizobium sp.]|uniref:creatininase family protein n=1 Tax=Bradyrhizobium sp. TaxID=376 RepID=UPI001DF6EED0|nr:creatininase family protein [Bradyrhizobium sp.]MBI5322214.1 creatininase family protein [Bradyrhizobium sp.]
MRKLHLLVAMFAFIAAPALAQPRPVWIDDLTWVEVRAAIADGKTTAIIFVGSSEQNGPHMAIGKHNFIARYCAEQIAGKLGDALVYPVIPFAITGDAAAKSAHMRFPGSVTLPPDVFAGVVRAVAQSALAAGFRLVALMGDHGGGQEEMARVAQALDAQSKRSGGRVLHVGDLYSKADAQFDELMARRGITSKELHAGIPDTSAILFLGADAWIRKDQIAAANESNGVQGSPALATAELGKLYLDMKVDNAVNQIRAFRANPR